ncbi:MAG: hypothetical protein OSA98_26355 [Rubripirellula sp.]|nr:hypothetical protein [Rubripirellula sp.]
MHKLFASIVSTITATLWLAPARVNAAHSTPLFHAICEYRHSAYAFGKMLIQSPSLDHSQRILIHRLIETSDRLYETATHSEQRERFLSDLLEVQLRFRQVRLVVSGSPNCPYQGNSSTHWMQLSCAFQALSEQVALAECLLCDARCLGAETRYQGSERRYLRYDAQYLQNRLQVSLPTLANANRESDRLETARPRHHSFLKPSERRSPSPSEWQLDHVQRRHRSSVPTRAGGANLGADISRLGN